MGSTLLSEFQLEFGNTALAIKTPEQVGCRENVTNLEH